MSASPQSTQLPVARMHARRQLLNVTYYNRRDQCWRRQADCRPLSDSKRSTRDCNHPAPCNLLLGFVGGDSSRQTAPSVRACYVTASECPNMPSGEGGGLLCTIASA